MDGVPFMISEKFACASSDLQQVDLMGITIKSLAEIEKEYDYSFRTEHSAAARLPPSPTRTSLSSEAWAASQSVQGYGSHQREKTELLRFLTSKPLQSTNK